MHRKCRLRATSCLPSRLIPLWESMMHREWQTWWRMTKEYGALPVLIFLLSFILIISSWMVWRLWIQEASISLVTSLRKPIFLSCLTRKATVVTSIPLTKCLTEMCLRYGMIVLRSRCSVVWRSILQQVMTRARIILYSICSMALVAMRMPGLL